MPGAPELKQFRTEQSLSGVLHLVFDMPGRSMNVFSNAAIEELGRFADWLPQITISNLRAGRGALTLAFDDGQLEVVSNTSGFEVVHGPAG